MILNTNRPISVLQSGEVLYTDSGTSLTACYGDCDCYYMDMGLCGLRVAILGTL